MSRVILASWMVRYPMGGILSWGLHYLLGLKNAGHDVFFVEKAGYENACYDPTKRASGNDCRYGMAVVAELLGRFGLQDRWCYVDWDGHHYGLNQNQLKEVFKTADVFIDSGAHGTWREEASQVPVTVLIDGEPAYTQMKWSNQLDRGHPIPEYDFYYTNGKNLGHPSNNIPTLGLEWRHMYSPVTTALLTPSYQDSGGCYSTVMNWTSHAPLVYKGIEFGQKDVEFQKFIGLPQLTGVPMEVAVSGKKIPKEALISNGWSIQDGQEKTISYDAFCDYVRQCRGEFSVCKEIFVTNQNGWFSDKSAAFLSLGKPVVLQDTGFGNHLPTGEGLFAVRTRKEAAEAIETIERDYLKHCRKAREIAVECLDATKTMGKLMAEIS